MIVAHTYTYIRVKGSDPLHANGVNDYFYLLGSNRIIGRD